MKNIVSKLLIVMYVILISMIIILIGKNDLSNTLLLLFFIGLFILTLIYLQKKYNIINKILNNKIIIIILIVVGVLLRLLLLKFNHTEFYSDEATYFYNAVNIAKGNDLLSYRYIAMFPYLYSYIVLISLAMKVFGTNAITMIGLNIFIDLVGAIFSYLFGKDYFGDKKYGLIMVFVWLFNPFQIVWCFKALSISIVNTMFMICLYLFVKLIKKDKLKNIIYFSIMLGLTLGISNAFRPIFIIFVIAIFVFYLYKLIFNKVKLVNYLVSFGIIILCFFSIDKLYNFYVTKSVGIDVADSSGGWSLYVGSNLSSNGAWFESERLTEMFHEDDNDFSTNKIHTYFKNEAINNYESYDIKTILVLFKNKLKVLTDSVHSYSYKVFINSMSNGNKCINKLFKRFIDSYYLLLLVSNIFIIRLYRKKTIPDMLIFIIIIEIGLLLSHLLVEVSPRYFLPLMVPLMVVMGYNIYELSNIKIKKEK